MPRNDIILVDGIIDDMVKAKDPSEKRDEAFEFFSFSQILKHLDLSYDEIDEGSIDGRDDGGVDGFFIFVNGHAVTDLGNSSWPKSDITITVHLITCKLHKTFQQAPLDKLVASFAEILDLSLERHELKGAYSEQLLGKRDVLYQLYRQLSARVPRIVFNIAYASRGDTGGVGDAVRRRSEQICDLTLSLFGLCDVHFAFVGAAELVALHRRVPHFSLQLPFKEYVCEAEHWYIVLSTLSDFQRFVREDEQDGGALRKYLFDSNVRDFMGDNRVNGDIMATLANHESPDFWWLNNGVTVLATSARVIGKTLHINDVQIVNGLQTTESIVRHFNDGGADPGDRCVMIKVMVSADPEVRDAIIRATNNQTAVSHASFSATDKVQRDIEEAMVRVGLYYERRQNYYVNRGIPKSDVVTPLYLASGFVTLALNSPYHGTRLKSRFMRSPRAYGKVFSEDVPVQIWPRIALILRRTDRFLALLRKRGETRRQRFLKEWRQLVAYAAVGRALGRFTFGHGEIIDFDMELLSDELFDEVWQAIGEAKPSNGTKGSQKKRSRQAYVAICKGVAEKFGLEGVEAVEAHAPFPSTVINPLPATDPLIDLVDNALSAQPWPKDIHIEVANTLGESQSRVRRAIEALMLSGRRFRQHNGDLFDVNWKKIVTSRSPD